MDDSGVTFISIDSLDVPTRMRMQRILWVARRVKRRGHECMGFPKASVEAVVPLFPFISFAQIISGFYITFNRHCCDW